MFELRIERFLRAWKTTIGWMSYQVGAQPRSLAASCSPVILMRIK
jgi:hypothetical protein